MSTPPPLEERFTGSQARCEDLIRSALVQSFSPPPDLTVSEWADEFRFLSPESSAAPGKYRTSHTAYAKGMMDAVSDPSTKGVVIMSSAQVSKTTLLENVVGYHVHLDPCPMLFVFPKDDEARQFSRNRLTPMFRDTPVLIGRIKEAKSRDSGSTVLMKQFDSGHLTLAGANSPSNLASKPARKVLGDEIDRWTEDSGGEGDPLDLALKRTTAYWNKQYIIASTPTIKGLSRIEAAYEESDQRHFWIPCPDCDHHQILEWANVVWEPNKPETAKYACKGCGSLWNDRDRNRAVKKGEWRAEEEFKGVAGFHLNEMYSPFIRLQESVEKFLAAKHSRSVERLRVWTNTTLGETWDDTGTQVDDLVLQERLEAYAAEVPKPVVVITAGVDVQDDRLELEIVGWNEHLESWSIDYQILIGDPATPEIWGRLDRILGKEFSHESGLTMKIQCTSIDSGGHHTQQVYQYAKRRLPQKVFAIKGVAGFGKPIAPRKPSRNNRLNVPLFLVGVDTAKEAVVNALNLETEGPSYCHFPRSDSYDAEYFKQLAAEKMITKATRGVKKRIWKKTRARNEALDCRVYALSALHILNPDFPRLADNLRKKIAAGIPEETPTPTEPETPKAPITKEIRKQRQPRRGRPTRKGGFVNGWR